MQNQEGFFIKELYVPVSELCYISRLATMSYFDHCMVFVEMI